MVYADLVWRGLVELLAHEALWHARSACRPYGRTHLHGFACLWGLGGLIWIKLLLPRLLKLINMIPWKSRYSATVIFTIIMLVDGVMTLQSLDYWYQRVNGTEPDIPVAQFYGKYFDNEYMENRFQSMTMSPKDATRV